MAVGEEARGEAGVADPSGGSQVDSAATAAAPVVRRVMGAARWAVVPGGTEVAVAMVVVSQAARCVTGSKWWRLDCS